MILDAPFLAIQGAFLRGNLRRCPRARPLLRAPYVAAKAGPVCGTPKIECAGVVVINITAQTLCGRRTPTSQHREDSAVVLYVAKWILNNEGRNRNHNAADACLRTRPLFLDPRPPVQNGPASALPKAQLYVYLACISMRASTAGHGGNERGLPRNHGAALM